MGINSTGMAAAYQGYQDEQRRVLDDARRVKADQRADQDAGFQEETRGRQRIDWAKSDKTLQDDTSSRAAIANDPRYAASAPAKAVKEAVANVLPEVGGMAGAVPGNPDRAPVSTVASGDSADGVAKSGAVVSNATPLLVPAAPAPATSPALAPANSPAAPLLVATGVPKARNFNSTLDQQLEFLNQKMARGTLSTQDYTASVESINKMKAEGIHDALALMSQGRYDDAMDKYNSVGDMRGMSVVKGEAGTTKINGQDTPTHFVTLQNADGMRTTMDVADAQYKLLDLNTRLGHADRARQTDMNRDQHADRIQYDYANLAQSAKDSAANRAIQGGHLALAQQQFNATTPAGMIAAREKATGMPMTAEQKDSLLGIDRMSPAIKMQAASVMKEQDQLSQAINKAQGDGTFVATGPDGKSNPLLVRQAQLNMQLSHLLKPVNSNGVNPLGLTLPGKTQPGQATKATPGALPATDQGELPPLIDTPGGVRAAPDLQRRNTEMALMNNAFGNPRRDAVLNTRSQDFSAGYAKHLSAIQPGMSRLDANQALEWFDDNADFMSNTQIKQLREARKSAGL